MYTYPLFLNFLPIKITTEHWVEIFLCYIFQFSLTIYIIHSSVNLSIPVSQLTPAPSFPLFCPQICPRCLRLYLCFANRFICTIFWIPHMSVSSSFPLSDITLDDSVCKRLRFIPFYSWVIFHFIHVPHFPSLTTWDLLPTKCPD